MGEAVYSARTAAQESGTDFIDRLGKTHTQRRCDTPGINLVSLEHYSKREEERSIRNYRVHFFARGSM
jgi:hypothetical protein